MLEKNNEVRLTAQGKGGTAPVKEHADDAERGRNNAGSRARVDTLAKLDDRNVIASSGAR